MAHTGEEYENPISGERTVVRLGSDDTDGQSVLVDLYLRPGGGPNEHVHSYLHETFEVLGGRVGFRLNGREEITGPGRKLEVPPGVVHDFWNAGDQEAHVLVQVAPGRRFEQMIESLWGMAAAGHTDARGAPKPLLRLAVFAKEFEREIQLVSPPRWLQRLLFSVLALIGRARGYRALDPRYAELIRRPPEHVVNRRLLAATVASTLAALVIPLLANPAAAHQAMDDAAARALAIVGLVVGALGLMAGVVALTRSHRSSGQAAPTRASEAATAGGRYGR